MISAVWIILGAILYVAIAVAIYEPLCDTISEDGAILISVLMPLGLVVLVVSKFIVLINIPTSKKKEIEFENKRLDIFIEKKQKALRRGNNSPSKSYFRINSKEGRYAMEQGWQF